MFACTKLAFVALAVLATNASAAKCTSAQQKTIDAVIPDTAACKKYWTTGTPPSIEVFCKDTACVASLARMGAAMPDCVDATGHNAKEGVFESVAYCKSDASSSPATRTPSTATPKSSSPASATVTPTTATTSAPVDSTPSAVSAGPTPSPTPIPKSAALGLPVQASAVILSSSLAAVVYMAAN